MSVTLAFYSKRKGASPPVSVKNSSFITEHRGVFRLK